VTTERWLTVALVVMGFVLVQVLVFNRVYLTALRDQSIRIAGQRVAEHIATERARGTASILGGLYLLVVLALVVYFVRSGAL
jgi:hypothetical protein